MAKVHVVSCGTSFLSNVDRRHGKDLWPKLQRDLDAIAACLEKDHALEEKARDAAFQDESRAAELSAMQGYLERAEVDRAYLVGTRTRASKVALRWLVRYLQQHHPRVAVEQGITFEGYEPDDWPETDEERHAAFAADLQVMRAKALDYVRKRQAEGHEVFIAAQGGFKPEVGVMMLVGAETKATVYYVHDAMRRPIVLPVLLHEPSLEEVAVLRAIPREGLAGDRAREMLPRLAGLRGAYAVALSQDEGGRLRRLSLTAYGKLLLERFGEG